MKIQKDILPENIYLKILNIYNYLKDGYSTKSYSQGGEDLILLHALGTEKKGFYVDVGAFHPQRFSNTFLFYKHGWRGINIDARRGSMDSFNRLRPKDINLEIPVSDKKEELMFYTFNEPAISGFLEDLSLERAKNDGYRIIKAEKMQTRTLEEILDIYVSEDTEITFLSVDVEGLDYNVLKSNNWEKYSPKIVLVEELNYLIADVLSSPIGLLMAEKGYVLFAKTLYTTFYKRIENN